MGGTPGIDAQLRDRALDIICEAISLDPQELGDSESWTYLGMTGLLATATINDLNNELGEQQSFPSDLFTKYSTVGDLKSFLQPSNPGPPLPSPDTSSHPPPPQSKLPLSLTLTNPPNPTQTLFLFPDGSGTGSAYTPLAPLLPANTTLIAFNSPHLSPSSPIPSIPSLPQLWLPTLLSHQPTGPYILGGWSAGGYYAYEMARLLLSRGEKVQKLILIDSPCRLRYEALPVEVVEELTRKGLMGGDPTGKKKAPEWLVRHFVETVKAVERYVPEKIGDRSGVERVDFVWVREGLVEDVGEAGLDVDLGKRVTRFLLEPRGELKSEGWEELVPGARCSFRYVSGNHFQITQKPHSVSLGRALREILEEE